MKKKVFIVLFVFLFHVFGFAQKYDNSSEEYFSFKMIWTSCHYVTPEKVYEWNIEGGYYEEFDRSTVRLDKNGYMYFKNKIFIPGLNYLSFDVEKGWEKFLHSDYPSETKNTIQYKSSSYKTEKGKNSVIEYSADNLGEFLCNTENRYTGGVTLYDDSIPWVEGVKGYGIGESITIVSKTPFASLRILNGFVDLERLDLYKKNSRVKTFKVVDLDNNIEYKFNLEDIVEIQRFYLSKETTSVKLIIEDVYKGDKWDDTCVTGILPSKNKEKLDNYENQTYTMFSTKQEILEDIDNAILRCK